MVSIKRKNNEEKIKGITLPYPPKNSTSTPFYLFLCIYLQVSNSILSNCFTTLLVLSRYIWLFLY